MGGLGRAARRGRRLLPSPAARASPADGAEHPPRCRHSPHRRRVKGERGWHRRGGRCVRRGGGSGGCSRRRSEAVGGWSRAAAVAPRRVQTVRERGRRCHDPRWRGRAGGGLKARCGGCGALRRSLPSGGGALRRADGKAGLLVLVVGRERRCRLQFVLESCW